MEPVLIIIWIIGILIAFKIASFVIKGAFKIAIVFGILALFFYLLTQVNLFHLFL